MSQLIKLPFQRVHLPPSHFRMSNHNCAHHRAAHQCCMLQVAAQYKHTVARRRLLDMYVVFVVWGVVAVIVTAR